MKLKDKFVQISENAKLRKLEKAKLLDERKVEEARKAQQKLMTEIQSIEDEKQRLLGLDDKALMVELVFAVRGFYSDFQELNKQCSDLHEMVEDFGGRITSIESDIERLKFAQTDSN